MKTLDQDDVCTLLKLNKECVNTISHIEEKSFYTITIETNDGFIFNVDVEKHYFK